MFMWLTDWLKKHELFCVLFGCRWTDRSNDFYRVTSMHMLSPSCLHTQLIREPGEDTKESREGQFIQ